MRMPWWHWVSVEYRTPIGRSVRRYIRIKAGHPWYWFLVLKTGAWRDITRNALIIDRADQALANYTGAGWIPGEE